MHEFDSMFPHILTNFFHIKKGDINLSDSKHLYSSFVFADAHVIEYPVDELKALKKQYEEVILELEAITATRKEINRSVKTLLDSQNLFREVPPTRLTPNISKRSMETLKRSGRTRLKNFSTTRARMRLNSLSRITFRLKPVSKK